MNYRDPYVQQWNFTLERDLGFNTGLRLSYDGSHGTDLGYYIDGNQVAPNTVGYAAVKAARPYPAWSYIKLNINGARSNYDAFTIAVNKRMSHGLQFQTSYVYAKNLSDEPGYNATAFTGENGGQVTNRFDPNLDYGNVAYTRRQRLLSTFLYDIPVGKGRTFMGNANRAVDSFLGGWELAGVLLFQTGPFLAVTAPGADPSGTNFVNIINAGRADIVPGVALYPTNQNASQWVNSAAFAIPANNIGRYGDSPVGAIVAPGTQAVSVSMFKTFKFTEQVKMQIGAAASNLLNHLNLGVPGLSLGTAAFGTITTTQTAEGAAPRSIQLSGRIIF